MTEHSELAEYGDFEEIVTAGALPFWRDPDKLIGILFGEVTLILVIMVVGLIVGIGNSFERLERLDAIQRCVSEQLALPFEQRIVCE